MPASEQTRYNTKRLHRIFAVASLALLAATIWMFIDDHYRPWKPFQRKTNEIELRVAEWQISQLATQERAAERERLEQSLAAIRGQGLDENLLDQFRDRALAASSRGEDLDLAEFDRLREQLVTAVKPTDAAAALDTAARKRQELLDGMDGLIQTVRFREDRLQSQRRAVMADLDAARALVRLAIRDDLSPGERKRQQAVVDRLAVEWEQVDAEHAVVSEDRQTLAELVKRLTQQEQQLQQSLDESLGDQQRLEATIAERRSVYFHNDYGFPLPGKKFLELPLLDAFNSPLRIETLWSDGLTQDFNSREVRRFDRCTTCHHAIDKDLLEHGTGRDNPEPELIEFVLPPAMDGEETDVADSTKSMRDHVKALYGLDISPVGLMEIDEATVRAVRADSIAARAYVPAEAASKLSSAEILDSQFTPAANIAPATSPGLRLGDVIVQVNGQVVTGPGQAAEMLLAARAEAEAKEEAPEVLPRVTIRRGLASPYAGHPRLDLFVSSLSPHPLAEFACTICHGGQGSGTSFEWTSHTPDSEPQRQVWRQQHGWFENHDWYYPMLPKRFLQASCLRCHHQVEQLLPNERFPEPPAEKLVQGYRLVRQFGCFGCHEINGADGERTIGPDLRLEPPELQAGSSSPDRPGQDPGRMRKPGPSLRYVVAKTESDFLADWIRRPRHFRPETRMPVAFGQWRHLSVLEQQTAAEREQAEIEGVTTYLVANSQPLEYLPPDVPATGEDATSDGQMERGRVLFESSGCLACHQHQDFPDAERYRDPDDVSQGPDLSAIADKLNTGRGRQWLYTWIKQPTRYDSRTLMPAVELPPVEIQNESGETVWTDPVDDIVQYLLDRSSLGYQSPAPEACTDRALDAVAMEYLRASFHEDRAVAYLKRGIPERLRATLKPGEHELLVPDSDYDRTGFALTREQKLRYVGRQAISKNGCFGCHDIPGFETAKPIGPALTDWGRKEPGKLAFDHVVQYLNTQGARSDTSDNESQPADEFYLRQLQSENRIGFLHQKLSEPRSFDYRTVENKRYNDWLHMPQFSLTSEQREAVMTFVLGLVAQPPTERFLYRPDVRTQALIDGQQVMDKYRCTACHMTQPQQWEITIPPGSVDPQRTNPAFPAAVYEFTAEQLAQSEQVAADGKVRATLIGLPLLDNRAQPMIFDDYGDELFEDEDYETNALEYAFQLWSPAVIEGQVYQVGETPLFVQASWIERRSSSQGGFLTNYLLPRVFQRERLKNSNAKGAQAWGWLPPPLIGQGRKVQADWLHDYLLDPYLIRPAVVLRMPRFNLSADEADKLVAYFAAVDKVDYPYELLASRRATHLQQADREYRRAVAALEANDQPAGSRLDAAMRIVMDKNYCVTCHVIGDYDPNTADRDKAPDLAQGYRRFRDEYLRQWIAKPVGVLPYTGMPVNIPYDPGQEHQGGVDQQLYHGTSVEQLEALVDLLMNFDHYARKPIAPLAPTANGPEE